MTISTTTIFLFGFIVLFGCQNNSTKENRTADEKESTELTVDDNLALSQLYIASPKDYLEQQFNDLVTYAIAQQWPVEKASQHLLYFIESPGNPVQWSSNTRFDAHYTGYLLDGQIFDSSFQRGKVSQFTLTEVIPAWQELLPKIGQGGKIKILTTSQKAYGHRSMGNKIEPYTPLIFEVEVVQIY